MNVASFPNLQDQIITICQSELPILINSGLDSSIVNDYQYNWDTNETTEEIEIYNAGDYILTVTDPINNCENTLTVSVSKYETVTIQAVSIDEFDVTVLINNNNITDYEFALDNPSGNFQSSNVFLNIQPGEHTAYARDIYHCNISEQQFYLIGFPNYFTPNNDGINDYWNIKGLRETDYPDILIKIFDRYGKLLKVFNPHSIKGWDGTLNGTPLTPDDYWYYLKLPTGKVYKGHFSLKN